MSRCHCRWSVPLIWGSLCAGCLAQISCRHSQPLAQSLCVIISGIILWQLVEYCIHRFLFHIQPSSWWGITLHFTFHGCHHKWPLDSKRLVFPPVPAAVIIASVFSFWQHVLPQVSTIQMLLSNEQLHKVLCICLWHCNLHSAMLWHMAHCTLQSHMPFTEGHAKYLLM